MDTHEKLRDQTIIAYNARPCSQLNPDILLVSYLMNPNGDILTPVDFEELPNDFPFFAYASIAEPALAEVQLFAGTFAPRGWAFTEGQIIRVSENQSLFALLGTTYGGDGRTTFALPDMRCLEADNGPRHIIALTGIFPSRN